MPHPWDGPHRGHIPTYGLTWLGLWGARRISTPASSFRHPCSSSSPLTSNRNKHSSIPAGTTGTHHRPPHRHQASTLRSRQGLIAGSRELPGRASNSTRPLSHIPARPRPSRGLPRPPRPHPPPSLPRHPRRPPARTRARPITTSSRASPRPRRTRTPHTRTYSSRCSSTTRSP